MELRALNGGVAALSSGRGAPQFVVFAYAGPTPGRGEGRGCPVDAAYGRGFA